MGNYINPGNDGFNNIIAGKYVDKTELIDLINRTLNTSDKLTCVSRPRRFGKSFSAKMLAAYYDKSCDSRELFSGLKVARSEQFEKYLNRFRVVYLDITDFISKAANKDNIVKDIRIALIQELMTCCDEVREGGSVGEAFLRYCEETDDKFFFIIDEWDALFREFPKDSELLKAYINLLRELFKNGNVTDKIMSGAYITGILPIKKYGTQSAVSDFMEYTMVSPGDFAGFIGFTEEEVKRLCEKYDMPFDEAKKWYDGYRFGKVGSVYNPNSLMTAIKKKSFSNYWGKTESYESIIPYIEMDFDGLKQDIISLLGFGHVATDIDSYQNDMTSIRNKDDVLTLLVHLGYLGYNTSDGTVYIPNEEARRELLRAVRESSRTEVISLINKSQMLLHSTLTGDGDAVAEMIAEIHETGVAPLYYNDEQSLRYVIRFAYIAAIDEYVRIEELPSGHGYADVVYLPKKGSSKPAMIIELKWDKAVDTAIDQIKKNNYPQLLKDYSAEVVMVGITYDSKSKLHSCVIEKG